jgi:integrase
MPAKTQTAPAKTADRQSGVPSAARGDTVTRTDRLTDAVVKRLPIPAMGNAITWDAQVTGLGARVTAAGYRSFVLDYRTRAGRRRRFTIGSFPDWSVVGAREEARRLRRAIDGGDDPLAELAAERAAPTVNDLIQRFLEEHVSGKRLSTQADYRIAITRHIQPALGRLKVAEVTWSDVNALHRKLTKAGKPTQANRVAAVSSKMFALAIRWQMRMDNPAKGIARNPETQRKRYATPAELERLLRALDEHADQQGADIFRLCMLTGCRSHEAMGARWDDIRLAAGTWTKLGATTKQKTDHVVPLSAPAKQLLARLRQRTSSPWVFPAPDSATGHRVTVAKSWRLLCKSARIAGLRLHDLRHSFASQLVSQGASLPLIGALLGHTQAQTTHRYAHLFDDPQREAVERIGKLIAGGR